jgi:hypothetical protein
LVGHITKRDSTLDFRYLTILLRQYKTIIAGAIPDNKGGFMFDNLKKVIYTLVVQQLGYRDEITDSLSISSSKTTELNLAYPPPCRFVYEKGVMPKCIAGHTDNIVPILYGLASEYSLKQAKKGKIYLGGCMATECDPQYYCNTHKREL